jgi:hypothetical protein
MSSRVPVSSLCESHLVGVDVAAGAVMRAAYAHMDEARPRSKANYIPRRHQTRTFSLTIEHDIKNSRTPLAVHVR